MTWTEAQKKVLSAALLTSGLVKLGQARHQKTAGPLLEVLATIVEHLPLLCVKRTVQRAVDVVPKLLEHNDAKQAVTQVFVAMATKKPFYTFVTGTCLVASAVATQVYDGQRLIGLGLLALGALAVDLPTDLCRNAQTLYGPGLRAMHVASFEPKTPTDAVYLASQAAVLAARVVQASQHASLDSPEGRLAVMAGAASLFAFYRLRKRKWLLLLVPVLLAPTIGHALSSPVFLRDDLPLHLATYTSYLHFDLVVIAFILGGSPFFFAYVAVVNIILRRHDIRPSS